MRYPLAKNGAKNGAKKRAKNQTNILIGMAVSYVLSLIVDHNVAALSFTKLGLSRNWGPVCDPTSQTNSRNYPKIGLPCVRLGAFEMSETRCAPQWTRWCQAAAIIICGLVALFGSANAGPKSPKGDITGTVSKAEPPSKQDGTPAHPFADASQCPSSTDLIVWPSGRSIPKIPPSIAVCFVGNQSVNGDRSTVHVRQR